MNQVAFSDEARADLRDAQAFYAAIDLRRVMVRRFPYVLVYREGATVQRVIAVAHTRRSRYWRGRR